MIQRIQSVYLLLIAALMAVLAIMTYNVIWWLPLVFILLGIASLVAIFLYKKRQRQMWVVRIFLLAIIVVLVHNFYIEWQVDFHPNRIVATIGIVCLVSGILGILALRAIRKDEKLVRSADRLR